ncbi:acetyltransferase [Vibrio sp. SS-MA-C1-2]|uniref:acetyltransferase n=1 Tax=Vibrio sp. SS-MA-C1-2 TaxID=2908646 RepID=UPI001F465AF1|nr:acetyltransferase [Vibrio sp. SS-MA-C1-2]UJF18549.1 acetyltransferase [Vibrio sp. SS-MA-C1-2]
MMLMGYTFIGFVKLIIDVLFSRVFYPGVRLIRIPFYIRGKKFVKIGSGFTCGVGLRIDCFPTDELIPDLSIGTNCQINDYVHIACINKVYIGNNVLMASKVFISDHNHGNFPFDNEIHKPPADRKLSYAAVFIADNVWLGESVHILPGVTIGKGAIVGAGSIVTKNIPDYTMAVGNPAKIIRKFNFDRNVWESNS